MSAIAIFISNPGMTIARFASTAASASRTTCSTETFTIAGDCFTREFHRRATSWNSVDTGPGQRAVTCHRRALQFGAQRFRKTRHVSFRRCVHGRSRNGKKTRGRADIKNRAALSVPWSKGSKRRVSRVRVKILTRIISFTRFGSLVANGPISPSPALLIRKSIGIFSRSIHSQSAASARFV